MYIRPFKYTAAIPTFPRTSLPTFNNTRAICIARLRLRSLAAVHDSFPWILCLFSRDERSTFAITDPSEPGLLRRYSTVSLFNHYVAFGIPIRIPRYWYAWVTLIFFFLTFSPNVPFLFFVRFIYTVQSLAIVPVSIDLLMIKIIMATKDPNRSANKELP